MQDNEPLMRALSNLIVVNSPDLVLFVGEALVGNDAVDQLTKFNQRLADLAQDAATAHTIDGILLTKFDTIDDKVGQGSSIRTWHRNGQLCGECVGATRSRDDLAVAESLGAGFWNVFSMWRSLSELQCQDSMLRQHLSVQVGAALSMVYTSGAPIMFVGCGQTYVDLKRLNIKSVVRSLLK